MWHVCKKTQKNSKIVSVFRPAVVKGLRMEIPVVVRIGLPGTPHPPCSVAPPTLHDILKESGETDCEPLPTQQEENINFNSYKFSKLRLYVANNFQTQETQP